jgi:hypothetical protein
VEVGLVVIPPESKMGTAILYHVAVYGAQQRNEVIPSEIFRRGMGKNRFQSFSLFTVHAIWCHFLASLSMTITSSTIWALMVKNAG